MIKAFLSDFSYRDILVALGIFAAVLSLHLFTYIPAIWHNDAFDFMHVAQQWSIDGEYHSAHWPDYPGWVFTLRSFFNSTLDTFSLIWRSQFVTATFTASVAAVFYFITHAMFRSRFFALAASLVLAFNPIVWNFSTIPMGDIPALFFILVSFFFYFYFLKTRKSLPLSAAVLFLGISSLFRLLSLFMIVPYFAGVVLIYFYHRSNPILDTSYFIRNTFIILIAGAIIPFIVYGPLWDIVGQGPSTIPSFTDIITTLRIYIVRDVGWFWALFMLIGFFFGFKRKQSRLLASLMAGTIILLVLYIAGWHGFTPGDTERYLIPAIPFGILAIGFLWQEVTKLKYRTISLVGLSIFTASYVLLSAWGAITNDAHAILKESSIQKLIFLPKYQISNTTHTRQEAIQKNLQDSVLASAIPPNAVVLNRDSNWSSLDFFFGTHPAADPSIIYVADAYQVEQKIEEGSLKNTSFVLVHRSLESINLEDVLKQQGFTFKELWGESKVFEKP